QPLRLYSTSTLIPYTTLFRSPVFAGGVDCNMAYLANGAIEDGDWVVTMGTAGCMGVISNSNHYPKNLINIPASNNSRNAFAAVGDRKSTRLNSSHVSISYAVF